MKRYFDRQNNRLVYIGKPANQKMWEKRWQNENINKLFSPPAYSRTHKTILDITRKYLPAGSKILEGGCGLGNNVFFLKQSRYEVIGIDYASKTVHRVKEFMPEIDIRCGDVEHLDFPDCFFDGYWSLGVIEHFYKGYRKTAQEMHRVLKPGGYLFMTVPAISTLRKLKVKLGIFPNFDEKKTNISDFYQYAFTDKEIRTAFQDFGFDFVEKQSWNIYKGVSDEIPGSRFLMSFLCRFLYETTWFLLKNSCNHINLFVFQKMT